MLAASYESGRSILFWFMEEIDLGLIESILRLLRILDMTLGTELISSCLYTCLASLFSCKGACAKG